MTHARGFAQRERWIAAGTLVRACGPHVCSQSAAMLCHGKLAAFYALAVIANAPCVAGEPAPVPVARVEVAPAKTSIYLGSVTMTMPVFVRVNGIFEAPYVAKVMPFFFYNEAGRLHVDFPEEALRRLDRGEPVEFNGRAVRDDGGERRVEGKATPVDARSGKLKVRVFYSRRIELIFNTTYRFPERSDA